MVSATRSSGASTRQPIGRAMDQRRGGAGLEGVGDEVVAVEIGTLQGDEQIVLLHAAAVDGDADGAPVARGVTAGRGRRLVGSPQHGGPRSAASARASVAAPLCQRGDSGARDRCIIERQRPVADDLAGLMALAGDDQQVAGGKLGDCGVDRCGAIADLAGRRAGGEDLGADARGGSSLRGLSSVTMTRSARRAAISPICGRLPRSRSPPQPNTTTSRPLACGRRVVSTVSSASGLWA